MKLCCDMLQDCHRELLWVVTAQMELHVVAALSAAIAVVGCDSPEDVRKHRHGWVFLAIVQHERGCESCHRQGCMHSLQYARGQYV